MLYGQGIQGFDVIDDGEAIPKEDLEDMARCMNDESRTPNPIYRFKSLGYRGEGIETMAFYTDLVVVTKAKDAEFGMKVTWQPHNREIIEINEKVKIPQSGTFV
jgi:DNA mismatch repair ATPase MutL